MKKCSEARNMPALWFGLGVFGLAVLSVLHYLWGDLLLMEYQTDISDTLMWADAIYKSGRLVSPNHYYPYIIPFGGQLLMLPFIPLFGTSMTTLRLGMTLFFALYALVLIVFFYRAVFCNLPASLAAAGCMIMLFEYNKKLREVMYAHVIHYSLAILFMLLIFIVLALLQEQNSCKRRKRLLYLALASVSFFSAANGITVLALGLVPAGLAFLLERIIQAKRFGQLTDNWREDLEICGVVVAAVLSGLAVYFLLSSGAHDSYSSMYMNLLPVSQWAESFNSAVWMWINTLMNPRLFADIVPCVRSLTRYGSYMQFGIRLCMIAALPLMLVLSIMRYKHLSSRVQRIVVLAFWCVSLITTVFYTVMPMLEMNWRMIPMLFMLFAALIVLIADMLKDMGGLIRGMGAMLCAAVVFIAVNGGMGVLAAHADRNIWFEEGSALNMLLDHGLTHGYTNAHMLIEPYRMMTDGEIRMSNIEIRHRPAQYYPILYQNDAEDYLPHEESDKPYFVMVIDPVAYHEPVGYMEKYEGLTYMPSYDTALDRYVQYIIYVFDHYPLENTMFDIYSSHEVYLEDVMQNGKI